MTITATDPFKTKPRISRDAFRKLLQERAAPGVVAERDPGAYWDVAAAGGVDPLFLLGMFNHESELGKKGTAVLTHSFGNTREPNFGATPIGKVKGRTGEFPEWRDWLDGCKSTVGRLIDPRWIYNERTQIQQIFDWPADQEKVWAPAGDLNDPNGYLRAVLDFMNRYADGGTTMGGDDSRFAWMPDEAEYGYPFAKTHGRSGKPVDYLIVHVTEGVDSLQYLVDQHESSSHYLTKRDGTPRAQMIAEADAAWTAGNRDYNERGINIEFERFAKDEWTRSEINNAIATVAPILKRNNIPPVYLGKDSTGKRGIIGHQDTPDGSGGFGGSTHHTDPGPKFPWDTFITGLKVALGDNAPPPVDDGNPWYLHLGDGKYTAHALRYGFRGVIEGMAIARYPADYNSAALSIVGDILEDEWPAIDGNTYQQLRNFILKYTPGNHQPWDVSVIPADAVLPAKKMD
jgi:hypothetical protein